MLKQRQSDVEYRKETEKRIRLLEEEKQKSLQSFHSLEHKFGESEKMVECLRGQIRALEAKIKADKDRMQGEREELLRKCAQMQSQQSQYQNEVRRREKETFRIQEQVSQGVI